MSSNYLEDQKARAKLRRDAKESLTDLQDLRVDMTNINSDKFSNLRGRWNNIFNKMEYTQELSIDAIGMKEFSSALRDQAQNMNDFSKRFSFDDLSTKIKHTYVMEDNYTFDWESFGEKASMLFSFTPALTTMLGPISKEIKQRKKSVRSAKEVDRSETIKPQEVIQEEGDQDEATSGRVSTLLETIREKSYNDEDSNEPNQIFSVLNLLVDPLNNVQTIENFFDFSFLIKTKLVAMDISPEGYPMATAADPYALDKLDKKQMVLSINMQELEELRTLLHHDKLQQQYSSANAIDLDHPLHRNDPIYNYQTSHEQNNYLAEISKQQTAERSKHVHAEVSPVKTQTNKRKSKQITTTSSSTQKTKSNTKAKVVKRRRKNEEEDEENDDNEEENEEDEE